MDIQVRYYTRSGNTKKVADAIAQALDVPSESILKPVEGPCDLLFLGSSYYAFDADRAVKEFIEECAGSVGKIVVFGTSAMKKNVDKPIRKAAAKVGIPVEREYFHCYGSFGPTHSGKPDEQDLKNAAHFAKEIAAKEM